MRRLRGAPPYACSHLRQSVDDHELPCASCWQGGPVLVVAEYGSVGPKFDAISSLPAPKVVGRVREYELRRFRLPLGPAIPWWRPRE